MNLDDATPVDGPVLTSAFPLRTDDPSTDVTSAAATSDLVTRWTRTAASASERRLEETTEAEDEVFEAGPSDAGQARPRRRLRLSKLRVRLTCRVVAVGAVGALLVAGLVFLGLQYRDHDQVAGARAAATKAARTDVPLLLTYDYKDLGGYMAKVTRQATPRFGASFKRTTSGATQLFTQYQATSKGAINQVGIVSATNDKVVLLMTVQETLSNTATQGKPNTEEAPLLVTMTNRGGKWLLDDLKSG